MATNDPPAPELSRLVDAVGAAQAVATGADATSAASALQELEDAWAQCPAGALDDFDLANVHLSRSTLRQLLDLDHANCLAAALEAARRLGPDVEEQRLLVQVLLETANAARRAGDFDAARPLIDEAIARADGGEMDEELAQAHNCLGIWARYRGEFALAREAYTTSLRILDRDPNPLERANVLHNLASLEHLDARPGPALELIDTALALRRDDAAREVDDAVRAAILIDLARYAEAGDLFRSLEERLTRRWGSESGELMHLNANWAVLEHLQGNLAAARDRYAAVIAAAERLNGPGHPDAAVIYANAAHLALTDGDRDTAWAYAQQALHGLEGRATADLPSLRLARQVRDALK